ncbi:MAG: RluA family pseudouridine synthase [Phocaeicola sp.]
MLHAFTTSIKKFTLPTMFINPFSDTPHPLCLIAANEVKKFLAAKTEWKEELKKGKMFGVLVVQTTQGEIGFIAAFSGILAGKNHHNFFVPPIYDFLQPSHYFKQEEAMISAINRDISSREKDSSLKTAEEAVLEKEKNNHLQRTAAKTQLKEDKKARDQKREGGTLNAEEEKLLIAESQYQKAAFKRLERLLNEELEELKQRLEQYIAPLNKLKKERKERSAALQNYLFKEFKLLNSKGEYKDLCEIFKNSITKTAPAGAGECAGPKLMQYAYLNDLKPLALAEFWWGESPKQEIRHHGYFYPPCKGKCEPIFAHMMQGLEQMESTKHQPENLPELPVLFEDDDLLAINKPAGMLSVPGKEEQYSVYQWMKERYPHATGPLIAHRLDMATSGILLLAKNKEAHKLLQQLFTSRSIKKQYVALLEGDLMGSGYPKCGEINLPLSPNLLDRPRQMVNKTDGKTAVTHYQLIGCEMVAIQKKGSEYSNEEEKKSRLNRSRIQKEEAIVTRVKLYPLTGRTHQLRLHAAHIEGMNAPILGDTLYGKEANRLYLHAERVELIHPITQQLLVIEREADF